MSNNKHAIYTFSKNIEGKRNIYNLLKSFKENTLTNVKSLNKTDTLSFNTFFFVRLGVTPKLDPFTFPLFTTIITKGASSCYIPVLTCRDGPAWVLGSYNSGTLCCILELYLLEHDPGWAAQHSASALAISSSACIHHLGIGLRNPNGCFAKHTISLT